MNAEPTIRLKKAVRPISVALGIAGLLFVGFMCLVLAPPAIVKYRVRRADYKAVLAGCREMIDKRDTYYPRRSSSETNMVWLDLRRGEMQPAIPESIRQLRPARVLLEEHSALLVFLGGFEHYGLRGFAVGAEQYGNEKLIDGLWIIHD